MSDKDAWKKELPGIDFSDMDNLLDNPKNLEKLKEVIKTRLIEKGEGIKDILKVPEEMIETTYNIGYAMYNQGNLEKAANIFFMLVMLDSRNYKYYFAIAACLHRLKEYSLACNLYTTTSFLNPSLPLTFYHIADCHIQLEQKKEAKEALDKAFELCGDLEEYAQLKAEVKLMQERL